MSPLKKMFSLALNNRHSIPPPKRSRSSHPEVFLRKGVLKLCSKFTGEHPCRSAISIKLLYYPANLLHIFRTPFLKNTYGRLLLKALLKFCYTVSGNMFLEGINVLCFICVWKRMVIFFISVCFAFFTGLLLSI